VTPSRRLLIGAIVLVTGAVGYAAGRILLAPSEAVLQPIAFNHRLHTEDLGMECDACHQYYRDGRHAGLPALSVCLDCHQDALTEQPEEQKIRDLAEAGESEVFRKLFRIPDNAFYSHRRHAVLGGIACETCHGGIAHTTTPPTRPLVRIDMDFCLECHQQHAISPDCTRCHR